MTHWDYRIVKRAYDGYDTYGIHEVYYEGNNVVLVSSESVPLIDNTLEGLKKEFELYQKAFEKPILNYDGDVVGKL